MAQYRRMAQLRTAEKFREHLAELGVALGFDETVESGAGSPLAQPYQYKDFTIGNRWSILPMEGWDGTPDGRPTEFTKRRWMNFGVSGAKLIWGGEAVAVRVGRPSRTDEPSVVWGDVRVDEWHWDARRWRTAVPHLEVPPGGRVEAVLPAIGAVVEQLRTVGADRD